LPIGFAILWGLALNYEIYLMARIKESRMEGRDSNASVIFGGSRQMTAIFLSGFILFFIFMMLLTSSTPAVNQIGWFVAFGILLTFMIISIFVITGFATLMQDLSYFPIVPPIATKNKTKSSHGRRKSHSTEGYAEPASDDYKNSSKYLDKPAYSGSQKSYGTPPTLHPYGTAKTPVTISSGKTASSHLTPNYAYGAGQKKQSMYSGGDSCVEGGHVMEQAYQPSTDVIAGQITHSDVGTEVEKV
jgi:hypothetical protein